MVEAPTELRVHGVSGTPPEAMLDHPNVRDDEAGFYRRRYPDGLVPPEADRVEAYSWGGLISGSPLRVLCCWGPPGSSGAAVSGPGRETRGWPSPGSAGLLVPLPYLALLLLGRQASRNPQLRRTIGILWDLATFWPRASHPLAPPCSCERALPDLISRIRAAAPTGDRRVVLSAHSQGTVIAAALVLQLEDDERERIRLVTYGSPLRRLYAGAFPVWFGPATLEMLGRLLSPGATIASPGDSPTSAWRWRNLYRRTDPIGGWVVADQRAGWWLEVDWQLVDPAFAPPPGDTRPPPIRGHSGYLEDPAYAAAVSTVLQG